MQYEDSSCSWQDLTTKGAFSIERHGLKISQPLEYGNGGVNNIRLACPADGRRFGRIDFSKGFSDWWFLSHIDLKVPSEHYQEGKRYDAEVQLAHFYSIDGESAGVDNQMATISIFLESYEGVQPYGHLERLICEWRAVEEQNRRACNLPSVAVPYPGCFNAKRDTTPFPTRSPDSPPIQPPQAPPTPRPTPLDIPANGFPTPDPTPEPTGLFPTAPPTPEPTRNVPGTPQPTVPPPPSPQPTPFPTFPPTVQAPPTPPPTFPPTLDGAVPTTAATTPQPTNPVIVVTPQPTPFPTLVANTPPPTTATAGTPAPTAAGETPQPTLIVPVPTPQPVDAQTPPPTPGPTDGATPSPTIGATPPPTAGSTPPPTAEATPQPTVGTTPPPTPEATPPPTVGSTPPPTPAATPPPTAGTPPPTPGPTEAAAVPITPQPTLTATEADAIPPRRQLRRGRNSVKDLIVEGGKNGTVKMESINFRQHDKTEAEFAAWIESMSVNDHRYLLENNPSPFHNYQFLIDCRTEYYFRYSGTSTVPPCYGPFTSNTRGNTNHWRVMKDPIRVHPRQIAELQRLIAERVAPSDARNGCSRDTGAKVESDGRVSVARPLQQTHRSHFKVFCECQDWDSKWQEDRAWCSRNGGNQGKRFYDYPYNYDSSGSF